MYSDRVPIELLGPAVEAARAALRRLDEDEVPPKLRKVASYQGGRLPAPLARGLLAALESDAWLRDKARDELPADGSDGASALFLNCSEGWEFELGRLVERYEQRRAQGRAEDLDTRVAAARRREAEAKRRWQDARRQIDELEAARRAEVDAVRAQLRQLREADRIEDEEHARIVADLEAARAKAEEAHAREVAAARALRERLAKTEEQRADVEKRLQAGGQAWGSGDPVALARHLDTLIKTVEADPALLEFTTPTAQRLWKLPPGARPDDRNSIDWLMRQARPFTLLVDGYNVTFRLGDSSDAAARQRLNEEISRFKLRAMAPVNAVIVYDSAVNPETSTEAGPGGVWLRFTTMGLTADDEIRRLAADADEPVVVVSSDREVREGSEQFGAIALWAEALIGWIRGR
jgi:predicted RNA-binding protein with PIN domain